MQALRKVPDGFSSRKAVTIHAWAQAVRLVANGIDGWPPISDAVYSVEEFIEKAEHLQLMGGAGEWDVLVYAVSDPKAGSEVHPYGANNPYRRLRSRPGERVKRIALFSYMRWNWYEFRKEMA